MSLKNYILNGPSVVIEDDDRDPHVSWRNHVNRVGRGGVDLVAAVGTPIYAPTDGVMDWRKNDGGAGNSCRFHHADNPGWKDVFSHLSRYVGKDMQRFKQGELIAYSGNTGGVTQHLHRHLLNPNDVRQNPWDYFTDTATAGAGTLTPLEEDDMFTDQDRATQTAIYNWIKGDNGDVGTNFDVIKRAAETTAKGIVQLDVPDTRNRIGNMQHALGILLSREGAATELLSRLSPEDLGAIAKAVQDEEDRRDRERLGK